MGRRLLACHEQADRKAEHRMHCNHLTGAKRAVRYFGDVLAEYHRVVERPQRWYIVEVALLRHGALVM